MQKSEFTSLETLVRYDGSDMPTAKSKREALIITKLAAIKILTHQIENMIGD